jgi:hypothetical protein
MKERDYVGRTVDRRRLSVTSTDFSHNFHLPSNDNWAVWQGLQSIMRNIDGITIQ